MANANENNVVKEDSKLKKFFKSDVVKTVTLIGTAVLTIANTVFLVWTCASTAEAEVNANVIDDYNTMKGLEVDPSNTEVGA